MNSPLANGPQRSRVASAAPGAVLAALAALFAVLAVQRLWYSDDAFAPLRVARQLAAGWGPAWNAGGPPDAAASPLGWTLLQALVVVLGADSVLVSWWLGVAAGVVGLVLTYWAARSSLGLSAWWALSAPLFLAAHRQYVNGAGSAQPTRVGAMLALGALVRFASEQRRAQPGWRGSGGLFFAGTLFLPAAPLLHLAAAVGFVLSAPGFKRAAAALKSLALHGGLLAGLIAVRMLLFGRPWPGSGQFHFSIAQLDQGGRFLAQFVSQTAGWLWGPLLVAGLAIGAREFSDFGAALLAQVIALGACVAARGGDVAEFRALDPLLAPLALLFASALASLLKLRGDPSTPRRTTIFALAALAVGVAQFAELRTPFVPFGRTVSVQTLKRVADEMITEAQALAPLLQPEDRVCSSSRGVAPHLTRAWFSRVCGGAPPDAPSGPAAWDALVAEGVMFVDVLGRFLFDTPRPGARPQTPWIGPKAVVYCARLPGGPRHYWIFASTRPQEEVARWLAARGPALVYAEPIESWSALTDAELRVGAPRPAASPSPGRD